MYILEAEMYIFEAQMYIFTFLIIFANIMALTIQLRIKELLKQKGYKPTPSTLVRFGIHFYTAQKMLAGTTKSIKYKDLVQLCIMLNCTPKEILDVKLADTDGVHESQPIWQWVGGNVPQPLQEINRFTPTQIEKLSKYMMELDKESNV